MGHHFIWKARIVYYRYRHSQLLICSLKSLIRCHCELVHLARGQLLALLAYLLRVIEREYNFQLDESHEQLSSFGCLLYSVGVVHEGVISGHFGYAQSHCLGVFCGSSNITLAFSYCQNVSAFTEGRELCLIWQHRQPMNFLNRRAQRPVSQSASFNQKANTSKMFLTKFLSVIPHCCTWIF